MKSWSLALVPGLAMFCSPILAQKQPERFWLAGRYDGNRVVIYFDAVKFKDTMRSKARPIPPPVAEGFFEPVELPASFLAAFQKSPKAEHFAIGDRYDLMLGKSSIATVKLTTLIGCESDEEVGNDSFIGALASVEEPTYLFQTNNYYAVRRHRETKGAIPGIGKFAELRDDPVRIDVEVRVAALLEQRMKTLATPAQQALAISTRPALKIQPFHTAGGALRYYVRAEWRTGKENLRQGPFTLAAWIKPLPSLQILAIERANESDSPNEDLLPRLLNVVDLGAGRTGLIIRETYGDATELRLSEYSDAADLKHMPVLQSISAGE